MSLQKAVEELRGVCASSLEDGKIHILIKPQVADLLQREFDKYFSLESGYSCGVRLRETAKVRDSVSYELEIYPHFSLGKKEQERAQQKTKESLAHAIKQFKYKHKE